MTLQELGYHPSHDQYRQSHGLMEFDVGRVTAEHKERYIVRNESGEFEGEILGNLRYSARSRSDFPAVGDWVAIQSYDDEKVLIHALLERKNQLERQAIGRSGEKQIIATNIDFALIMQAVDRDFNLNRIERYLTLCHESGVSPIIVLNKIDLISESTLEEFLDSIKKRVNGVPVFKLSNATQIGLSALKNVIKTGRTYCLLGSSGVGKSSLINNLTGASTMKTNTISQSNHKGRHVTTHRELTVLSTGGIFIDNPGMREVGMIDAGDGLQVTFDEITELSAKCRFKDCTHTSEDGCAIIEALENGTLDQNIYENYQKMEREKEHFESTVAEKRKKEKSMSKMVKYYVKAKKKNRM
jgi:ribosome biogenesis GTPase